MIKYFIQSVIVSLLLSPLALMAMEIEGDKTNFHPYQTYVNDTVKLVVQLSYDRMNKNWSYSEDGVMKTDSRYWTIKDVPKIRNKESNFPTLILNCSPLDIVKALSDLINKPAHLDCTIALCTAQLLCMQYMMGIEEFTAYAEIFYNELSEHSLYSVDYFFTNLSYRVTTVKKENYKSIPGTMVYLTSVPSYTMFKPNGRGQGENVFCMGENIYLGFGEIFKEGSKSSDEIERQAFNLFCSPLDVEINHEQHKAEAKKFRENINVFKEQRTEFQIKKFNSFVYFDIVKLIKLDKHLEQSLPKRKS